MTKPGVLFVGNFLSTTSNPHYCEELADRIAARGDARVELDQQVLRQNRAALAGRLRDQAQHKLRQPESAATLPQLRREMTKQRRLSPLRRTLRECASAIRSIKPCFMMSPLTVAQLLEGLSESLDSVDEVTEFDVSSQNRFCIRHLTRWIDFIEVRSAVIRNTLRDRIGSIVDVS